LIMAWSRLDHGMVAAWSWHGRGLIMAWSRVIVDRVASVKPVINSVIPHTVLLQYNINFQQHRHKILTNQTSIF